MSSNSPDVGPCGKVKRGSAWSTGMTPEDNKDPDKVIRVKEDRIRLGLQQELAVRTNDFDLLVSPPCGLHYTIWILERNHVPGKKSDVVPNPLPAD